MNIIYKKIIAILISIIVVSNLNAQKFESYERLLGFDFDRLNKQAAMEYLTPIRPGDGINTPFWNKYAQSFIYAPCFEFVPLKKASYYVFTINDTISFKADSVLCPLSEVWNKVPVGKNELIVKAFDKKNRYVGVVGQRSFEKKYPFAGPYVQSVRSYKEAALKGLFYFCHQSYFKHWLTSQEPDMSYIHNAYPCKIVGATISIAVMIAQLNPEYRENAIKIAKNAAQFLINNSHPEGAPLAFFPPTYYGKELTARKEENIGKAMMMEAVYVADAFLDLYDLTHEKKYLDQALGIAGTYLRTQSSDGSWPVKVDYESGIPVNDAKAIPTLLISLFDRLEKYGYTEFCAVREKAFDYIKRYIYPVYDWHGQFEDMTVFIHRYENMTNCTAAPYAELLLKDESSAPQDIRNALELVRFCEDQFTIWDVEVGKNGIHPIGTPCVFEQYHYQTPVDDSACNVINALIAAYDRTKDPLLLAKAISLANTITVWQDASSGFLSTLWMVRPGKSFWMNCTYKSVKTLLFLDKYLGRLINADFMDR